MNDEKFKIVAMVVIGAVILLMFIYFAYLEPISHKVIF